MRFHSRCLLTTLAITLSVLSFGPTPTNGQQAEREGSASRFSNFEFRYVGPTRGGRVTAVAGTSDEPGTFYFGATGGGIWKTTDYGTSWKNVSDGYFSTPSIGAIRIAVNDANVVYAGTGTDGLRSNIISGKGVYKSIDGGNSWKHVGLDDSGQIGAVEIDPRNHNTVFVAAIGNAFKPNSQRGVFRTVDGGISWERVLHISDSTGFSDLEFMPSNPDIVYATAWRAERKPWTIISGSRIENGIFRSINGGDTWDKIGEGLPVIQGKIDLAVTPADSRLVYALVEAQGDSTGLYRSEDHGETFEHVSSDSRLLERAFYYTNLDADPQDPLVLHSLATRYVKSKDGGKTWSPRSAPHGDHHDMWINPENPDLFVQANDGGANVTFNGGETWTTQLNQPTAELYQVEVDNQYPYWIYGGQQDNYTTVAVPSNPRHGHQAGGAGLIMNTGGCETGPAVPSSANPDIVYANCKGNFSVYNKATGQEQRYSVGGQYMYGHNPADLILRFQRVSPIHESPHNPDRVFHTSQYVHVTEDGGKTWNTISPDLTANEPDKQVISGSPITRDITGEEFYSTIYSIRESTIAEGTIWVGANDGPVHVTRDGGQTWTDVTPKSLPSGARIDSVEPSPHDPAVAYIAALTYQLGDARPYLFRTSDYGASWTKIVAGIPDDAPTRVVREDPDRQGLLYAGTEWGLYISFDDGDNWVPFQHNLPVTPVTDIKLHRKDLVLSTMGRGFWVLDDLGSLHQKVDRLDLDTVTLFAPRDTYRYRLGSVRSTSATPAPDYSRSGVIMDYVIPAGTTDDAEVRLEIRDQNGTIVRRLRNVDRGGSGDSENADRTRRDMATNQVEYSSSSSLTAKPGVNRFRWDTRHMGAWHENDQRRYSGGPMVAPGSYVASLTVDSITVEQPFNLLMDPNVKVAGVTENDVRKQVAFSRKVIELLSSVRQLASDVSQELADVDASTDSESRNEDLRTLRELLVRSSGRYTQPMLISQVEYLYGMLDRADQLPGNDMIARHGVLLSEYQTLADRFAQLK